MTRDDTQQDAKRETQAIDPLLKYNAVINRRHERVRGLWERNGVFYAQVKVRGWTGRVPLHNSKTVSDAQAARQALKAEIKAGTWKTPMERGPDDQKVGTEVGTGGANGEAANEENRVLSVAIERYQQSRDLLGKKDPKTGKREDSGLKRWAVFKPQLPIAPESFDQKLLLDYAEWRKKAAKKKGRAIAGRTIDVDVTALANVVRWCVVQKWLAEFPAGWHWDALAEEPDECELLTDAQIGQLCSSAMSVPEMGLLDRKRPRPSLKDYVEKLKVARARFSDYLRLLSLCGARETETLRQRWSNVRWTQRKFHFPGGRKGGTKRGGGSRQAAKPRDIDFFDKLEAHLKDMYERRDPKFDWLFPNEDGSSHVGSYRKQLERVRDACELPFVGFHHFRHYFISWCVMKAVDVKTIARWVGHLDEGLLILQKYGHLAPGHGQEAAKKLDGPWH
jgi:integrase